MNKKAKLADGLSEAMESVELPVVTSIGWVRTEGNNWSVLIIRTQGDKVVSVEAEEPNMKPIAFETLKIKLIREVVDKSEREDNQKPEVAESN